MRRQSISKRDGYAYDIYSATARAPRIHTLAPARRSRVLRRVVVDKINAARVAIDGMLSPSFFSASSLPVNVFLRRSAVVEIDASAGAQKQFTTRAASFLTDGLQPSTSRIAVGAFLYVFINIPKLLTASQGSRETSAQENVHWCLSISVNLLSRNSC
jgi:hypothetical protein